MDVDHNKQENKGPSNGIPDGSPRNQPLSGPKPRKRARRRPTRTRAVRTSRAHRPGPGPNTSPGLIVKANASSMSPVAMPLQPAPPATDNIFSAEFIQSVANGLDQFVDVGLFGDLNFERDFAQWFNPDDAMGMELGRGPDLDLEGGFWHWFKDSEYED
ncbi:hypothetical protein DFH06DRAFT_1477112 [Mycena polygramma]|nr:hypothetical protein DFH06DRAFT_1477112 [Mycena polygramma]